MASGLVCLVLAKKLAQTFEQFLSANVRCKHKKSTQKTLAKSNLARVPFFVYLSHLLQLELCRNLHPFIPSRLLVTFAHTYRAKVHVNF